MTAPTVPVQAGSLDSLPETLEAANAASVLLVTGETSYRASGAKRRLPPLLGGLDVDRFSGFQTNPRLVDVREGIRLVEETDPDVILAVGGGTVLDMAKMVNVFAANQADPQAYTRGEASLDDPGAPLIAVPTTAGSGSEATQFAVLYIDGEKHSIDEPHLFPDDAILDPTLTLSMPPRLTAVTGMDALCQGIESLWAVGSTRASRAHAREAVRIAWENLEASVHEGHEDARASMVQAANHAGQAINVSRTTAPHAVSYTLTMEHGIPHGHAVALTLGEFIVYNGTVDTDASSHPKGSEHVRSTVEEVCTLLGQETLEDARQAWYEAMERLGLETRLQDLNVDEGALDEVAKRVNVTRAKNNPRTFDTSVVRELLANRGPLAG